MVDSRITRLFDDSGKFAGSITDGDGIIDRREFLILDNDGVTVGWE